VIAFVTVKAPAEIPGQRMPGNLKGAERLVGHVPDQDFGNC
jgi:hypothetical protein